MGFCDHFEPAAAREIAWQRSQKAEKSRPGKESPKKFASGCVKFPASSDTSHRRPLDQIWGKSQVFNEDGEDQVKAMLLAGNLDEAIRLLVEMYQQTMWIYTKQLAYGFKLVYSVHDFDDVWQETLIGTFKYLKEKNCRYDGRLLWLLMLVARRRMADRVRQRTRWVEHELFDLGELVSQWEEHDLNEVDELDELVEAIWECFSNVSQANQDVLLTDIRLFFERGEWVTAKELANAVRNKERTVSSQRARGRQQIRECLEGKRHGNG